MSIDAKILKRIEELIEMGKKLLATKRAPGPSVIADSFVDSELAYQWATSVQNLLVRVFGESSEHYKNFMKITEKKISATPAKKAFGVLKAAKDDFENEHLYEIRSLVEADVFDDFLEQASALLKAGYFQPAAVIAGSVLEDGLRKLCAKNGISLPAKPKLDSMNSELAKASVYKKLTQKKITALADIRNSAAHGKWSDFSKEDVIDMISWVNHFMESNYA